MMQVAVVKADRVTECELPIVLTRRESIRLLELIESLPRRNETFLQTEDYCQSMTADADPKTH